MRNNPTPDDTEFNFDVLPDSGFVRLAQLIPSVLPVSVPTLNRLIRAGAFPAPKFIAPRCKAWRVGDVRLWLARLQNEQTAGKASNDNILEAYQAGK